MSIFGDWWRSFYDAIIIRWAGCDNFSKVSGCVRLLENGVGVCGLVSAFVYPASEMGEDYPLETGRDSDTHIGILNFSSNLLSHDLFRSPDVQEKRWINLRLAMSVFCLTKTAPSLECVVLKQGNGTLRYWRETRLQLGFLTTL